jgi:hypothetical protein
MDYNKRIAQCFRSNPLFLDAPADFACSRIALCAATAREIIEVLKKQFDWLSYPRRAFDSDRDMNEVVLSLTGENMSTPESRRLAEAVLDKHVCFETALAENRRTYPLAEFKAFVQAARLYIEAIGRGNLIDRRVASVLYGLSDFLTLERKTVPDQLLLNELTL